MKVLMFYELAADGLAKVQENYPAHAAHIQGFHQRGELLMVGPYGHPPQGALGIFTSQEAAEAFSRNDPFVLNGVVGKVTLHPWAEVLASDPPAREQS